MENRKTSRDFKIEAIEFLRGRWKLSIILCLVIIVQSIVSTAYIILEGWVFPEIKFFNNPGVWSEVFYIDNTTYFLAFDSNFFREKLIAQVRDTLIGGVFSLITIGISLVFVEWLRNRDKDEEINMLSGIKKVFNKRDFFKILALYVIKGILTFLWSILFVIPGIIKSLAYSQAYYLYRDKADKGEGENIRFRDYLKESNRIMEGNKWRLFCLQFSLLGWTILEIITFGIASIWVIPYKQTILAAFYQEIILEKGIEI